MFLSGEYLLRICMCSRYVQAPEMYRPSLGPCSKEGNAPPPTQHQPPDLSIMTLWMKKGLAGPRVRAIYDINDTPLGEGGFGSVFLGTNRETREEVAIKVINKAKLGPQATAEITNEIRGMQACDHKSIMKYYCMIEEVNCFELCLELIKGGDLFDRINQKQKYTENDAREVCRVVLSAIEHMHQRGVVHRDLKPENLMLRSRTDDLDILIVDFGLSKTNVRGRSMLHAVGTLEYNAPEMLRGIFYGKEVDLWALGVIVYIILSGQMPFWANDKGTLRNKIVSGRFAFPEKYFNNVSTESKSFIERLLCVNVDNRLTAASSLEHEWLIVSREQLEEHDLSDKKEAIHELSKIGIRRFKGLVNLVIGARRLELIKGESDKQKQAASSSADHDGASGPSLQRKVSCALTDTDASSSAAAVAALEEESSPAPVPLGARKMSSLRTDQDESETVSDNAESVRLLSALTRSISNVGPLPAGPEYPGDENAAAVRQLSQFVRCVSVAKPPHPESRSSQQLQQPVEQEISTEKIELLNALRQRQTDLIQQIIEAERVLCQAALEDNESEDPELRQELVLNINQLQEAITNVTMLVSQIKVSK